MSSTNTPSIRPKPAGNTPRWRDYALLGGLLGFVALGLLGMAAATGWQEMHAHVAKLNVTQIGLLLILSLVNYLLRGFRWHFLVGRLGLRVRALQSFRHYFGGFAMTVTPGRLGEFVRMRWLGRETGATFAKTAPLAIGDRATDLAAMGVLLAGALVFSTTGIAGALPVTVIAVIVAIIATRPALLSWSAGFAYQILGRWPRIFARIRGAATSLAKFSDPRTMAIGTGLGVIGWFAEGYSFYLLLSWMGADIGLPTAMAIFIFSTMAGGLTGAPGGLGGAEAAMIALLTLEGVPPEVSLPATAIIRLTTLWFAIAIGIVVFPIAERQSKKVKDALEKN